ncbi:cytochrome c peroxidase [Auricularia subglabra TFB-10046 SS5]|nr:cytochrome c peroxidase [Auricularia subglabra TFB-10046 SS5]
MASVLGALRAPARRTGAFAFTALAPTSRPATRSFATTRFLKNAAQPSGSAPKASSNTALYVGLGAFVAGGVGYWFATSDSDAAKSAATAGKSAAQAVKAKTNFVPTKDDYQKVYNKIAETLEVEDYDDGSYGPVYVRLAWHSSGTYDKETNTGGSNYATMRFEPEALHGANAGLDVARGKMEEIKKEFPWISYGDLWTLGGVAAIQEAAGPKIPWRPGRIDGFATDATPDGRLPDATQGADHLRHIFYRMGLNDQEIVALAGAHALGRCHPNRSGFDGPWTFSPTTFTNAFYELLFSEKWVWRKWNGPKQLQDKKTQSLMMLPTDYVLITDKSFKQYAKKYAQDEQAFFKDFSAAFAKLMELGVPSQQWATPEPWELKTLDEQKA